MQHGKSRSSVWRLTAARNLKPGDMLNDPRTGRVWEVVKVEKRAGQVIVRYPAGTPSVGVTVAEDRTMRVLRKRREKGNEDGTASG